MRFFEFDTLHEIIETMRHNKLRTFLTGFSVAWGIFMLIVLLASGNGLQNGVLYNFSDRANNSVNIWTRETSMPYMGFAAHRRIKLPEKEMAVLKAECPEIDEITGVISHYGSNLSYRNEYNSYNVFGVQPNYDRIELRSILPGNGRFINDVDILQYRKVMVINPKVAKEIFKGEDPLGKYVKLNEIPYQVVGISQSAQEENDGVCYIPLSTAQLLNRKTGYIDEIYLTVNGLTTVKANEDFSNNVKNILSRHLYVHPDDTRTFGVWNIASQYIETMKMFSGIQVFVFIIGLCTLIAGIVGVGNIMIITVKERSKEFGIKKAIGATPANILKSVLLESLFITTTFGYIGMMLGIGLMETVNKIMGQGNGGTEGMSVFRNPTVDINTILVATLILIIAGLLAGFFPARKAVSIKPVEAMRAES